MEKAPVSTNYDRANLSQGLYPHLAPVSYTQWLRWATVFIDMIDRFHNVRPTYTLEAYVVASPQDPSRLAPVHVNWSLSGRVIEQDAVLGYYGAPYVYSELCKKWELSAVHPGDVLDYIQRNLRQDLSAFTPSPLGDKWAGYNPPRYSKNLFDVYANGAVVAVGSKLFKKQREGGGFFGWGGVDYWEELV